MEDNFLTVAYGLAQAQAFQDKVQIEDNEIMLVRGVPFIIRKKLDRKEKTNFTYYEATRVNIGPIQNPAALRRDLRKKLDCAKRTLIIKYKKNALRQMEEYRDFKDYYKYTHFWVTYIPQSKEIVGTNGKFWSYGNQVSDVRAYLGIAILEGEEQR